MYFNADGRDVGLAIWDDHKQELFCARDRIGIEAALPAIASGADVFWFQKSKQCWHMSK